MILSHLNYDLSSAQEEIFKWMQGHKRWRQIALFLTEERDRRHIEFFPVSCFGQRCAPDQAPPPGSLDPKWMHEPLIWGLQLAKKLADSGVEHQSRRNLIQKTKAILLISSIVGVALFLLFLAIKAIGSVLGITQ